MESQEKNEPRGRGAGGCRGRGIDKTRSSRIVLVLRGLIFAARARIAPRWVRCALALMILAAGCNRHSVARLPAPPSAPASVPAAVGSTQTGIASWYGVPYHGRLSASGEIFDMEKMTAAHPALPFQTWVEVTNLSNGKQVDVRITDRGPFVRGRIIDLSMAAARQLDMMRAGTAHVRLRVIDAPVNALDDPQIHADGYAVQVGAFSERSRAEALRSSLPFSDARIVEPQVGPHLWRVLVGHALRMQAAAALAADVKKAAGEAVVVKE
jgi:rare lipoprotein A